MESGREAVIPLQEIDLCKIMKCDKQERINNLQSKIDKAIEYIENNLLPSHDVEKTDWEFEEVIFSDLPVERIKPLIDILKEQ